ncbi:MAG: alpha-1,2-fucosyltransferase [Bryocella sp.]
MYQQQVSDAWNFREALDIDPFIRTYYLKGHLQAHQFTAKFETELRREFRFKNATVGINLEVQKIIHSSTMPVSLHVRRGDYVPKNKDGNIALPMSYYDNAIVEVRKRLPMATFFVFSDDIAFARLHLEKYKGLVFVDHNDEAHGYEDLRLMSSCRHHVIANSTLSWWGAWLNPDPNKLVFAPDRWITTQYPHTDLIPPTWIRVPANGSAAE